MAVRPLRMKASPVEYYEEEEEKPAFCLDVVELKDPIELPPLPPPKDVEEVLLDGEVRCRESVDAPRGTLAYASLDHALSEKVKWEIATRDLRRSQLPEYSAERTADLERRGKTFALRWKLHGYVFIAREPFFKKFKRPSPWDATGPVVRSPLKPYMPKFREERAISGEDEEESGDERETSASSLREAVCHVMMEDWVVSDEERSLAGSPDSVKSTNTLWGLPLFPKVKQEERHFSDEEDKRRDLSRSGEELWSIARKTMQEGRLVAAEEQASPRSGETLWDIARQARKEGRLVSAEKQVSPRSGETLWGIARQTMQEGRLVSAEQQASPRSGKLLWGIARQKMQEGRLVSVKKELLP